MWRIDKVECENFISFKKMRVEIPQHQCTLIYGINLDNDKQKNNGTGKSSLIEAIAFGLTGEPLRGVDKAEEIINDHADTAHVVLELSNDYDNTQFIIDRTLSRKTPQQIHCAKYDADGNEIDKDKTVQPSVLDYNRYILDEIGLTKDDIYSNFILSNTRYKSFFEANDKQKKAMINRFSGADIVDEAIANLQVDKQPVQDTYDKAKENKVAVDAKVDVIRQQIEATENGKEVFENDKAQRIKALEDKIAEKRGEERNNKEAIKEVNERLDKIDEVGAQIEDMQYAKYSLAEAYNKVNNLLGRYGLCYIKDYLAMAEESEKAINERAAEKVARQETLDKLNGVLDKANKKLAEAKESYTILENTNKEEDERSKAKLAQIAADIDKALFEIGEQSSKTRQLKNTCDNLDSLIREAKIKLHGAITCPKCGHEFFLHEKENVDEVKKTIKDYQCKLEVNEGKLEKSRKEEENLNKKREELDEKKNWQHKLINARFKELDKLRFDVNDAATEVSKITTQVGEVKRNMEWLQSQIEGEQGRIEGLMNNMLQEALDIIDNAIDKGESNVKNIKEQNVAIQSSIEAFEKSIETIKNSSQDALKNKLEESLTQLKADQQNANNELEEAKKELDKYVLQEKHFVEFRSYLANKKVEAIAGVTNYFLELIGSDLRVEMLGYKKLKNGSIRDKITVNLLRGGVPCGSFCKFSGGERARVNLASILGLQRLTNNSADKGKGLDIVVLDEILEASDTTGIESSCEALNRLKVTSLMVTQNPIVGAEVNTLVVKKENGYSIIEM